MTREEFINNYIKVNRDHIHPVYGPSIASAGLVESLIGSIYDQQQVIEYLDNRIIDLERLVYK